MNPLKLSVKGLEDLPKVAQEILDFADGRKVFTLEGDMGAGKTTLIKELCRQLGSDDHFSSPTFSIVNEYALRQPATDNRQQKSSRIYHMDLYRIESPEEAQAAGVEEYLSGRDYCFVEWPEQAKPFLPEQTVEIQIKTHEGEREITIFRH